MLILIVHRDQSVMDVTKEILIKRLGYYEHEIGTTTSPEEAQLELKDQYVTLVLCGAAFSGYEDTGVIAEINSVPGRQGFILMAYTGGGEMDKCLSAGADGFIALPTTPAGIVKAIGHT